jgi:hypothetical protein
MTNGATVHLSVQLWSVNQRETEADEISIAQIRYHETSNENIAKE